MASCPVNALLALAEPWALHLGPMQYSMYSPR